MINLKQSNTHTHKLYKNITNQKSILEIHAKKKREFNHNTEDSHQITREESIGAGGNLQKSKTINKIAIRTCMLLLLLLLLSLFSRVRLCATP